MKKKLSHFLLSLFVSSLFFGGFAFASSEIGTTLITNTVVNLNTALYARQTNIEDKKDIINNFCKIALDPEFSDGFSSEIETYESRQSLFLYLLCTNNDLKTEHFSPKLLSYLKPISFTSLKVDHKCRSAYLEDCNVAQLADDLMVRIFSELFTLKQAEIFGIMQENFHNAQEIDKKINAFALEKYRIQEFCTSSTHKYPETCNLMKNHMKSFFSAFQKLKILDTKKLFAEVKSKDGYSELKPCSQKESYDLLLCGTLGETDLGLKPFINLLYNELARYTIFSTYYGQMLSQRDVVTFPIKDEIVQLQSNLVKFQHLTNQTLDDLLDFSVTYPIHIGLIAYQEDLLRFRDKSLSKMVTPFYFLYHKFRNAQTD